MRGIKSGNWRAAGVLVMGGWLAVCLVAAGPASSRAAHGRENSHEHDEAEAATNEKSYVSDMASLACLDEYRFLDMKTMKWLDDNRDGWDDARIKQMQNCDDPAWLKANHFMEKGEALLQGLKDMQHQAAMEALEKSMAQVGMDPGQLVPPQAPAAAQIAEPTATPITVPKKTQETVPVVAVPKEAENVSRKKPDVRGDDDNSDRKERRFWVSPQ